MQDHVVLARVVQVLFGVLEYTTILCDVVAPACSRSTYHSSYNSLFFEQVKRMILVWVGLGECELHICREYRQHG